MPRFVLCALLPAALVIVSGCIRYEPEKQEEDPLASLEPKDPVEPGPIDPDAPTRFTKTESGLKYRILRKTDGKKPTPASTVVVHYRGWLDDEAKTEFDSSYKRGEPATFPVRVSTATTQGVIPGWVEGLQLVSVGGMIELEIPPDLAYGKEGGGPIPGNATLHFVIELIKIQGKAEEAPE